MPGRARRTAVRVADLALRIAGGAVALAGGVAVAVAVLVLAPLRVEIGDSLFRVPAALAVAVGGMVAVLWFAPRATGVRWSALLPVAAWFAVIVPAAWTSVTPAADGGRLLAPDDLLGAVALAAGTVVAVAGLMLAFTTPGRPLPRPAGGITARRG
jgi:hypothetical protein